MDIGTENLRQSKRIDNRVETLCIGIATVWNAIDDEEVDVFCPAKTMEKGYLFAHPFRLGGIG